MKNFNYLIICVLLFFSIQTVAQTHIWTGNGGDNEFSNQNNWDVLSVPDATSNVLISGAVEVLVSGTELIGNLELNNEANLIVEGTLETMEVILVNADFIVDGTFTGNGIFTIDENSQLDFISGTINSVMFINDGVIEVSEFTTHDFNGVLVENNNMFKIFEANLVSFLNSTFMNTASGVFDAESNGGFTQGNTVSIFDNGGLIRKTPQAAGGNGTFYMIMDINNEDTIEIAENETFLFLVTSVNLTNGPAARIVGDGILDITATFVNEGTISPGNSGIVGSLEFVNTFNVDPTGDIEIDLMSPTAGEFDSINVVGSPQMNGELNVNVLEDLQVGDSFPIITWSQSGSSCNFPQFVNASFNSQNYTFEVFCNPNDVTLEVSEIILGNNSVAANEKVFRVSPNPITEQSVFYFSSEILAPKNKRLYIYNSLGQLVFEERNLEEAYVFERGNLPSGLYFAKVQDDHKLLRVKKIVLE